MEGSCRKMVEEIKNTKNQVAVLESELDLIFNLMLVYCHKRLAYLLETANFWNIMDAQELLGMIQTLFPDFSYTVESWIGDVPHRIFVHRTPLLKKRADEPHDEWIARNLGFECLGLPDENQKRYVISYSVEDTEGVIKEFYTELCPISVNPASFSKQQAFQQVADLVDWTVTENVIQITPDSHWLDSVKHAYQCPTAKKLLLEQEDALKGFLEGSGIEIFEHIPLEDVLKDYYPWLVMSLLSITTDPLEHLYALSPAQSTLLDAINANMFEKYKNEDPPFFYNDESTKKLHITLEQDFPKLFDEEDDKEAAKLTFQEVEQDLIKKYEELMATLGVVYRIAIDEETDDIIDSKEDEDFLTTEEWRMIRLLKSRIKARKRKKKKKSKQKADRKAIRLILKKGGNINQINHNDETPLMTAVRIGDVDLISSLLQRGADVDVSNAADMTVFDFLQARPDRDELERLIDISLM